MVYSLRIIYRVRHLFERSQNRAESLPVSCVSRPTRIPHREREGGGSSRDQGQSPSHEFRPPCRIDSRRHVLRSLAFISDRKRIIPMRALSDSSPSIGRQALPLAAKWGDGWNRRWTFDSVSRLLSRTVRDRSSTIRKKYLWSSGRLRSRVAWRELVAAEEVVTVDDTHGRKEEEVEEEEKKEEEKDDTVDHTV